LACPAPLAAAECKPEQRLLWDALRCPEPMENTWYQLEVHFGCAVRGKSKQTEVEIHERAPDGVEVRKKLRAGQVKNFVMNSLLKGKRKPDLFTRVLPGGTASTEAPCGEVTRQPLGKLTCGDVGLEADVMCRKVMNIPMPHILFMETGGAKPKERGSIHAQEAMMQAHRNVGQQRLVLMKRKLGRKGELRAEALLKPDGGMFDYVELIVEPAGHDACHTMVDVRKVWSIRWEPGPRHGFLEAVAIPSMDGSSIDGVQLTISPMTGQACSKVVDIRQLWQRQWQ
jgi:hypothetical protein